MQPNFRPVPLSIIDFFGVVVPGFIWLVLLVTTVGMFVDARIGTPVDGMRAIAGYAQESQTWLAPMAVVFASFVIGYAWKPKAMSVATFLGGPLIRWSDSRFRGVPLKDVKFPFRALHFAQPHYALVLQMMSARLGCDVETLPGPQPFTAAKHLLHLIAPALWEDLEHREGEVRLVGVTFLGAIYSLAVSVVALGLALNRHHSLFNVMVWIVVSVIAVALLGHGFGHLRVREVDYTYTFVLLAGDAAAGSNSSTGFPSGSSS